MTIELDINAARDNEELQLTLARELANALNLTSIPFPGSIHHKSKISRGRFSDDPRKKDYDLDVYRAAGFIEKSECLGWVRLTDKFLVYLSMLLV